MAVGAAIIILLAAIGGILLLRSDDASADEVFLEPVGSTGDDPFTDPVTVDNDPDSDTQQAIDSNARSNTTGATGVQTFDAGEPGLYGGTQSSRHCDRGQLVTFLEANPTKAAAWADVQGITTDEIAAFVDDLTPVLLREDTRVTNHGFVSGTANRIPAVLQAGTAVLVDRFGRPVVKCACGNPLAAPAPASSPRYTGTRWTGFTPTTITVIQQTTIEIDVFVLTDPLTGDTFRRPAGTDGDEDTPDEDEPPPTVTVPEVTQPPTTPPPVTPPPPEPTQPPSQGVGAQAILDNARAQCAGVVFPFEDHISERTDVFPTGQTTLFEVVVTGDTASGNQQVFSWLVDEAIGSLTPNNALAAEAAQHCSALGG
jgi:hypothetical protein